MVAAPGATAVPRGADVRTVIGAATVSPTAAPTAAPRALTEADAIRAARACYDAVCDTSIFTFDEFAVSAAHAPGAYTVVLESIYGNGCAFTAVIDDATGSVLRHSTPHLATSPASVSRDVPAVAQWYQKNGPLLYTWPQAEQAEFSRRYEGGALRAARPGELTEDEAKSAAAAAARDAFESLGFPGAQLFAYPMLYAERASADGAARYVVHCFAEAVTNAPAAPCVLVTLRAADGAVEDVRIGDETK